MNDELWADWCFANDLAHLEDIATVLEVEVDDLVVAVDFIVANSDSSEVVDLEGESFSIRDVYLSTFDLYFDVLHLSICLRGERNGRFEVGSGFDLGFAGHCGQSHSEGKYCQKEYIFLHNEAFYTFIWGKCRLFL